MFQQVGLYYFLLIDEVQLVLEGLASGWVALISLRPAFTASRSASGWVALICLRSALIAASCATVSIALLSVMRAAFRAFLIKCPRSISDFRNYNYRVT